MGLRSITYSQLLRPNSHHPLELSRSAVLSDKHLACDIKVLVFPDETSRFARSVFRCFPRKPTLSWLINREGGIEEKTRDCNASPPNSLPWRRRRRPLPSRSWRWRRRRRIRLMETTASPSTSSQVSSCLRRIWFLSVSLVLSRFLVRFLISLLADSFLQAQVVISPPNLILPSVLTNHKTRDSGLWLLMAKPRWRNGVRHVVRGALFLEIFSCFLQFPMILSYSTLINPYWLQQIT